MQAAITVQFSEGFPDAGVLGELVARRFGREVSVVAEPATAPGYGVALSSAGERVGMTFQHRGLLVIMETEGVPSHFQWVIVAALEELGGRADVAVPELASRKWNEASWWEKMQWKHRFLGS